MSELLPCPHCGNEKPRAGVGADGWGYVECDCGAYMSYTDCTHQADEAIAVWNTRAGEQAAYERGKTEVQTRWKAQRESIIQTLEEWQAAYDGENESEYQRAIGDVLAWLNGDIP